LGLVEIWVFEERKVELMDMRVDVATSKIVQEVQNKFETVGRVIPIDEGTDNKISVTQTLDLVLIIPDFESQSP